MATTIRHGLELAYDLLPGREPIVVFLPGFASDMSGTKATLLRETCAAHGQAMLRLDYSGHGASQGRFTDGCIGDWTADAAHIIAAATSTSPLLLIGSSMGGWIALLLALQLGQQVRSILLIAPAPDFTERLIRPRLSPAALQALQTEGVLYQPSVQGEPPPLTWKLLQDGRQHLLLDSPIAITCPVRILHGLNDQDVPYPISLDLAARLASTDVQLTFIKDAEHRLSRSADLALLRATLFALLGENSG